MQNDLIAFLERVFEKDEAAKQPVVDEEAFVGLMCGAYDDKVDELGDLAMERHCNDVPMWAVFHAIRPYLATQTKQPELEIEVVQQEAYQRGFRDAQEQYANQPVVWQPIETAPRDGSVFVGVNSRGEKYAPNPYMLCFSTAEADGVSYTAEAGWRQVGYDWPCYPTHWMPLPAPPTKTKEG